ncbi:methionyl-tRNA formyltransferase [Microvirga flavescens]|uniref:methionyl-tRNA formyltransferase n=1 Tax=Microvirga flavescens TaxID=2249811 RepID=UPI000DD7D8A8|nr:formyltransferase family protein [Microvirga flavescens]
MRFAFAGIDFLGDVFLTLLDRGWQPLKLFSRPCDAVYDFNDVTISKAHSLNVPVQMSRILPSDLAQLREQGCEALIVAGYPWLITGWEGHIPYAVNFHPSPLPQGRGPYPLFRAVLDSLPEWGMTVHALAPSFDTGPILTQDLFPLTKGETHDTLLAKCQMAGKRMAHALAEDLPNLWAQAKPQGAGSYWPRITQKDRTLDWTRGVEDVLRRVNAFGSIESVAEIQSRLLHVWSADGWTEHHEYRPGTLAHRHRNHLVVAASDGFVQLTGWSSKAKAARARD